MLLLEKTFLCQSCVRLDTHHCNYVTPLLQDKQFVFNVVSYMYMSKTGHSDENANAPTSIWTVTRFVHSLGDRAMYTGAPLALDDRLYACWPRGREQDHSVGAFKYKPDSRALASHSTSFRTSSRIFRKLKFPIPSLGRSSHTKYGGWSHRLHASEAYFCILHKHDRTSFERGGRVRRPTKLQCICATFDLGYCTYRT